MNPSSRARSRHFVLLALALAVPGCGKYKEPNAQEPHAVLTGEFLGGEAGEDGLVNFGYSPGWSVCKGRKAGKKCNKAKFIPFEDGRRITVRLPVGKEITVNIGGYLGKEVKKVGSDTYVTWVSCYGDPLYVTPQPGDRIEFAFMYDPDKGCGTLWKTDAAVSGE